MPRRHAPPPRADARPGVPPHAAGPDIGREEIWACVPEERDDQPVRSFGTVTPALLALAEWLVSCRIATVALESTGVSGSPVSEMLEARGFNVSRVNAPHLKQVPGRKSESQECQWMQHLHTCGLLRGSLRPEAEMCAWRAYLRHRARLLAYRAAHIQHLQKALHQMHVQLPQVRTASTGVTGLAIIRAIVAGERDPVHWARFREPPCARSTEDIAQAWTGHSPPEPGFALKRALALYEAYTAQVRECDTAIEPRFRAMKPVGPAAPPPLHRATTQRTHTKNAPLYDARGVRYQLPGVALVAIPGLHASPVQTIPSGIGLDLRTWPNAQAFCSWVGLAPHQEISGGKLLRRRTLQTRNRAGQACRLAAPAVSRSPNGLGAFSRRLRARVGPPSALVATAHTIARLVYDLLPQRTPFRDLSAAAYERRTRAREIAAWRNKATRCGFTLVESTA